MRRLEITSIEDYEHRHYNALESEFEVALDASVQMVCVGVMAQSRCYKRHAADVKPAKYGLQRLGVDFSKYPDFPELDRSGLPERDIYYLRAPTGDLDTVILCTAEEAKTVEDAPKYRIVGQCEQKFVFKPLNALVSINYRRVYLQDWHAIQAEWERLMQSFIVEPSMVGGAAAK